MKKAHPDLVAKAATTNFPSPCSPQPSGLSDEEKIEHIASCFADIMQTLGLDLQDESLSQTPYRVAKMYIKEIFQGLDKRNFPDVTFIDNSFQSHEHGNIIFMKMHFHSFCEHHFVPMNGTAYVAYFPCQKVIGLSKIPRIVHFFARRPQVQERLTAQIADSLVTLLETEDVAVSIAAEHFCVAARGIEQENSHATTNVLRGKFQPDTHWRKEFFEAVNREIKRC